jgi:hypothetical protein
MVLSGPWKTSYQRSLVSRPQGGGDKKAGIPPTANIPDSVYNAYVERGNGILSLVNMRTNRLKRSPTQNLPLNISRASGAVMR